MTTIAEDHRRSTDVAEILKALGHPLRLQIVAVLCSKEEHVGALAEQLQVSQSTLSQQIGILRMRGLVAKTCENGKAVYRLAEPRLPQLIRCLEGCSTG